MLLPHSFLCSFMVSSFSLYGARPGYNSQQQPFDIEILIIPILQVGKLRFKVTKWLAWVTQIISNRAGI